MAQPRIQSSLKPDSRAGCCLPEWFWWQSTHPIQVCVSYSAVSVFHQSLFPPFHLIPNVSCFEISVRHNTLKKYNSNISENKSVFETWKSISFGYLWVKTSIYMKQTLYFFFLKVSLFWSSGISIFFWYQTDKLQQIFLARLPTIPIVSIFRPKKKFTLLEKGWNYWYLDKLNTYHKLTVYIPDESDLFQRTRFQKKFLKIQIPPFKGWTSVHELRRKFRLLGKFSEINPTNIRIHDLILLATPKSLFFCTMVNSDINQEHVPSHEVILNMLL